MGLEGTLAEVLGKCLERKPEERPSVDQILEEVSNVADGRETLFKWFEDLNIEQKIQGNRKRC